MKIIPRRGKTDDSRKACLEFGDRAKVGSFLTMRAIFRCARGYVMDRNDKF